ncbi:hypothetical protein Ssi03_61580 [Sphaerisporangium siamense]|uniref:Uncharacterized protein (TIGR02246 family) n=1 Tax=Sphaerisporangium siamense TaxID=795645 RepID=A0A7W7DBD0_9ACTN|nr:SgcJ/EcaC family oxidoreductase [Sphaerisporangium siamense]MBB4702471.1 uncharacterized protein (TIGR02246 family) [Sphaerisporangium siamense]GII88168.1 hypothetical protein Ssi03_61580 [Sphaerisporangium siamense]
MASPTAELEKAAVAAVPFRIVTAWARKDAKAFADVFTPDGTMILPGSYNKGTAEIEAFMADAFTNKYKNTTVTGTPLDLRFLTPDTAVITTGGGVLAQGETIVSDKEAIRATWVITRYEGDWKLAAYQNCSRDEV